MGRGGYGGGVPLTCYLSHDAFDVTYPYIPTTLFAGGKNSFKIIHLGQKCRHIKMKYSEHLKHLGLVQSEAVADLWRL